MNNARAHPRIAMAGLVALGLLITSCSSDSKPAGNGNSSSAETNEALLGPSKPASGAAIKLGFITEGQSATTDARPELASTDAAVKYINEHLGGITGRPIELITCQTHLTPAGAADCANQMVAAKIPVVLEVTPGEPQPIVTALDAARIPYFVDAAVDPQVLLSPNSYVVTNTLGGLASPVKVASDSGVQKVATLLIDVPAAVGPIKALGQPLFDKAGLSVDYVAIPPGTPDMTPQVQDALGRGAQMFNIIGDPAFCISALGALNTLGFNGVRLVNPQCLDSNSATSIPGGIDGVKVATTESLDARDPEVALYEAAMAHYSPGTDPHFSSTSGGFAIVLAFARAMSGLSQDLTPDSVRSTLASMVPQPQPLLNGQTFKCDHSLFKLTPAVCSSGIAIVTLDADGKAKDSVAFDTQAILNS